MGRGGISIGRAGKDDITYAGMDVLVVPSTSKA